MRAIGASQRALCIQNPSQSGPRSHVDWEVATNFGVIAIPPTSAAVALRAVIGQPINPSLTLKIENPKSKRSDLKSWAGIMFKMKTEAPPLIGKRLRLSQTSLFFDLHRDSTPADGHIKPSRGRRDYYPNTLFILKSNGGSSPGHS